MLVSTAVPGAYETREVNAVLFPLLPEWMPSSAIEFLPVLAFNLFGSAMIFLVAVPSLVGLEAEESQFFSCKFLD